MIDILDPSELPELPPAPDEADIAQVGGGELPPSPGQPRLDVARKLQRQVAFLRKFAECGVVVTAARAAGVSTRLVYGWWRKDPLFEAAYQEAMRDAADVIEAELVRRGVEGVDVPVVHMGVPTMLEDAATGEQRPFTIKSYSDGCLMALIKARKPDQFAERRKVEHDVKGGSGVLVVPAPISAEEWEKAASDQQARFRPGTGQAGAGPEAANK